MLDGPFNPLPPQHKIAKMVPQVVPIEELMARTSAAMERCSKCGRLEPQRTDDLCPLCCTAIWTSQDRVIDRKYGDEKPRHLVCAIANERDTAWQQLAAVTAERDGLRKLAEEVLGWGDAADIMEYGSGLPDDLAQKLHEALSKS